MRKIRKPAPTSFSSPIPLLLLLAVICSNIINDISAHANVTNNNKRGDAGDQSSHHTPILEAEARTARELSHTVQALQTDLSTCHSHVDAIQSNVRNFYAARLANVLDGLKKKRKERGTLTLGEEEWKMLEEELTWNGSHPPSSSLSSSPSTYGQNTPSPSLEEDLSSAWQHSQPSHDTDTSSDDQKEKLIQSLQNQVNQLRLRETAWERTINELVARRDLLERREGAWERTIGELMAEVEVRAKREDWYEGMKVEMEGRIGMLSRVGVLERFGPGPHHVSIKVQLDDDDTNNANSEIILELAPVDLMPHSVHLFLSQISEGYWSKGTPAIVINAGHVLQACPHPCLETLTRGNNHGISNDEGTLQDPYIEMKNAGIDSVSFQEYSPFYPHEKYTIGFAGRPHSGPEFYFNLMNNTLDHGPMEQRKKELGDDVFMDESNDANNIYVGVELKKILEPDPCFGKVVKGFDVVDAIAGMITRGSVPKESKEKMESDVALDDALLEETLLLKPVKIVSMNILEDYSPTSKEKGGRGIDDAGEVGKDEL
ncbi:hypothetical protein ACHAXS_006597 [Conticribra weissflogii]